jgi:putative transposase
VNRFILDQEWGELLRQLEYKMAWNGGLIIAVQRHHTSQTCPDCSFEENADVVNAVNVLNCSLAALESTA